MNSNREAPHGIETSGSSLAKWRKRPSEKDGVTQGQGEISGGRYYMGKVGRLQEGVSLRERVQARLSTAGLLLGFCVSSSWCSPAPSISTLPGGGGDLREMSV